MNKTLMRAMRAVVGGGLLIAMLTGSMGLNCGGEGMQAFREEAVDDIGAGVRTILDAMIDGTVAAINEVGTVSTTE